MTIEDSIRNHETKKREAEVWVRFMAATITGMGGMGAMFADQFEGDITTEKMAQVCSIIADKALEEYRKRWK